MTFEEAKAVIDSIDEAREAFGIEVDSPVCCDCEHYGCPIAEGSNDGAFYITRCNFYKREV